MAKYERVGNHWELVENLDTSTVDDIKADEATEQIDKDLDSSTLQHFLKHDAPNDYCIRLFIPRYYMSGDKVSSDVIATIFNKISKATGMVATWNGKGFITEQQFLDETKQIYVEILAQRISADRATLLSKYLGSVIGKVLEQDNVFTVVFPVLTDSVVKDAYDKEKNESFERVKEYNEAQQLYD